MADKDRKYWYIGLIGFGLLLAGIAWYFDSDTLDQLLLPPSIISVGLGTFLMGFLGLRCGRIYGRSGYVYREESPILFWLLVVICQVGGGVMLIAGIVALF